MTNSQSWKMIYNCFVMLRERWVFAYCLIGFFLFVTIRSTYYNYLLEGKGVCEKAEVIAVRRHKGYGRIEMEYRFAVNNTVYIGRGAGIEKVGDTIFVVYFPENPKISRPSEMLKIDCNSR